MITNSKNINRAYWSITIYDQPIINEIEEHHNDINMNYDSQNKQEYVKTMLKRDRSNPTGCDEYTMGGSTKSQKA